MWRNEVWRVCYAPCNGVLDDFTSYIHWCFGFWALSAEFYDASASRVVLWASMLWKMMLLMLNR